MKDKVILIIIVCLAVFLRFYQLGQIPSGFHEDEAAYGYNAYSLLQTGKDEYGKSFPFVLKSFGEYKPALYAYLDIPFVALFDLQPFSVRIVSAIFGLLTVPLLYFLASKLFLNKKIALFTAFLLAVTPWHINLSRTTSEVVVSVFFLLLLVYAMVSLRVNVTVKWFLVAVVSGLLAIDSYTASRFFVVLISGLFFVFSTRMHNKKLRINSGLLLLVVMFIGFGIFTSLLDKSSRFNQVSIVATPETKLVLEEQIREDQFTPPVITRAFHNKVINYARTITQNFGEYFTLDYLVLNGGYPYRMRIPASGLLYFWQIPFLFLGLYVLIRKKNAVSFLILGWWVLLLIPAAITFDEIPNVYRSLVVLPAILFITAVGMHKFFFQMISNKMILSGLACILILVGTGELLNYQHQYYVHQELHQPWHRNYAYELLVERLNDLSRHYKKIVMTKSQGGTYISLLFWRKYDPSTYQAEGSPADTNYTGFDNYYFVPDDCPREQDIETKDGVIKASQLLYVMKGKCKPAKGFKLIETINWKDNTPAFKLFKYIPSKIIAEQVVIKKK